MVDFNQIVIYNTINSYVDHKFTTIKLTQKEKI